MTPEPGSSVPVPIKLEKRLPSPPLSAALGMAASYYGYPFLVLALVGLLFLLLALIGLQRTLMSLPGAKAPALKKYGILLLAATVGFSLGIAARRNSIPVELGLAPERVIAVSGILREDPRTLYGGSGMGILELNGSTALGAIRASARGRITVFFPAESIPRLKEFGRGCEIYADGTFTTGGNAGGNNAEPSRGLLFRASSVHVVKPAPALEAFRTGLRTFLLDKFQNRQGSRYGDLKPPVWGGLASALLLGVRDDLDVALSVGFRDSGCSHILALSGMHLAIISSALAFLIRRPLGIRWASIVGAAFILVYVFVAGSQPSLVRAAIMYLIGTFALLGFLKGKPLSLLCLAFIIQLLLQGDTGISLSFMLSYLALLGILTLGVALQSLFRGRLPDIIAGGLSASIGAFIFTAPVVTFYFGSLRPVGIVAGLLLAPISSVFMIFSLAAMAVSFLPFPLWDALDFALTQIYRILESIVSIASHVPGFSVPNALAVLAFSLLFWLLILFLEKRDIAHRNNIASFD